MFTKEKKFIEINSLAESCLPGAGGSSACWCGKDVESACDGGDGERLIFFWRSAFAQETNISAETDIRDIEQI